ncbi:mucin-2-like, partial [Penaeus monodon]|uniref:mucin-2-like n=1 Tax=Penaeus monodon TaxID=6687 RepID=UPI0018A7A3D4
MFFLTSCAHFVPFDFSHGECPPIPCPLLSWGLRKRGLGPNAGDFSPALGLSTQLILHEPHLTLNTCTGTISISPANFPIFNKIGQTVEKTYLPASRTIVRYQYSATPFLPDVISRSYANCGGPHNVLHRCYSTYKFESEVTTLRFRLGLTLCEARQEARRCGFSLTPYSSNTAHSTNSHKPTPPTPNSPSSVSYLPQSNSFAILNPDTPISTTDTPITTATPTPSPLPPRTTRNRQNKRSTPSSPTTQTPPPSFAPTLETPILSSPPHKKSFIPKNSQTNSSEETIEDIQDYLMKTDTQPPNLTTPAPFTLQVTADIHPPPNNIPPTPYPPNPSQHSPLKYNYPS